MLKRYLDFINEKLKSSDFENDYYWFINIFDTKLKNTPVADNIYGRNERTLRDYVSNDEAKKIVGPSGGVVVLANDSNLSGSSFAPGHHNHFHIAWEGTSITQSMCR